MHKSILSVLVCLTVAVVLSACATPYQKRGFLGGYEDFHIKDNVYYVQFSVNGYTSTTVAAKYFHQRAKELCIENGYEDYQIVNEQDTSGAWAINGSVILTPSFGGNVECLGRR